MDNVEKKRNNPEVIIKDLVSSFLIPDVERKKVERALQFKERRFLEAARKTIKQAEQQAGVRLDGENMLNYASRAAAADEEEKKEEK